MLLMWSDTGFAGNQGQRGVQWLQGCKWAAITVVVVASPMLGKVSQVTASRSAQSAQSAHAQTAITVVVVASPMLGKVSQVTASLCPVCPVCPCPDCCRRTALYQITRHPLSRHLLMLPRSWWRAHALATGEPA